MTADSFGRTRPLDEGLQVQRTSDVGGDVTAVERCADAAEARRLMDLAESHSWYAEDGDLARVQTIIAAAQVYATLARADGGA